MMFRAIVMRGALLSVSYPKYHPFRYNDVRQFFTLTLLEPRLVIVACC